MKWHFSILHLIGKLHLCVMNHLSNIGRKDMHHLAIPGVALNACNPTPSLQVPDPVNESARVGQ